MHGVDVTKPRNSLFMKITNYKQCGSSIWIAKYVPIATILVWKEFQIRYLDMNKNIINNKNVNKNVLNKSSIANTLAWPRKSKMN